MICASCSAAGGLRDAAVRLDVAAHTIANARTPGFAPAQVVSVAPAEGGVRPLVLPAAPPPTPARRS